MLRIARPLGAASRRCLSPKVAFIPSRSFAERKDSMLSSDPAFLPGSASRAAPVKTEVPLGPGGPGNPLPSPRATPASPSTGSVIPPENVPKIPPSPTAVQSAPPTSPSTVSTPPTSSPTPPPLPPPAPKRRFRLIRVLLYLIVASALGYGGAVFYALRNDNFHDFFTEYVPFGEDAVLYFEERSFRKRFPNARLNTYRTTPLPKPDDSKVTIPQKSGLSWKVAGEDTQGSGSELTTKGKHMSAVDANEPKKQERAFAKQDPVGASGKEKSASVEASKEDAAAKGKTTPGVTKRESLTSKSDATGVTNATSATNEQIPAIVPVSSIAILEGADTNEPTVKQLVTVINDLITVINADDPQNANKYSAPLQKAKEQLQSVASQIGSLRQAEKKAAEAEIAKAHHQFDEAAKELLAKIDVVQKEDQARYLEEFEAERAKIASQYEERLKTELDRAQQIADQRLQNELSERSIEMKRDFIADVRSLVETERDGRLSKLSDLSTSVNDLTNLTSNWNGVIDSNLATQRLQVAVDTVRSAIQSSNAEAQLRPFVREMAALKLTAEGDPVIEAAIASVSPAAYQRGIPSTSQLIDRFRRVASEVRKASLLPEDAGVASHAASVVLSRVLFRKQGQPDGNDVESILTRTETLLEQGDLDTAAREMNALKGWAGVLSKDWLSDVRKVLEVRQALDVCETEARLQCLRLD